MCNPASVPDPKVTSALQHWGPRFISNGVDPGDFARVTAGIDRWEQWCDAWCRAAEEHERLGRAALAESRLRSAGSHLARAATYYHFAKFLFVDYPDQMRAAHLRAAGCLQDALPHLDPPGTRVEIPFDGGQLVGVLRLPGSAGPHPVVVLVPGLDSAKEEFRVVEQHFLDRGLATFAVDGPGQGEAEYLLPARPDWEVPGRAIMDRLAEIPEVDSARVGVWGVSLGGYYAPRWASGDPRVLACVAVSGPFNWGNCWDNLPELTRRAFVVRTHSGSEARARELAGGYTLEGVTERITAPLQIVFGKQDRLVPWPQARRLADEVKGPVECLLFEDGNHACANITYRHRYRTADWMAEQLRVGG